VFIDSLGLIVDTRMGGDPSGAEIVEIVDRGSLANVSGLHVGDVINSLNGKPVGTAAEFAAELSGQPTGSRVRLGYMFKTSAMGWIGNEKVVTLRQQPETPKTAR
jgi:S1-C subfamily serine protease